MIFSSSVVAFSACMVAVHGLPVFEYALYNDTNCTQEIYTGLIYKPIVKTNESDGTQIAGDIGQCHAYDEPKGDFGSILLDCDTSIGTPTYNIYSNDTCCTSSGPNVCSMQGTIFYSSTCSTWKSRGFEGIGVSSSSRTCNLEDSGPSTIPDEAIVNYVAAEYYDPNCTNSTGEQVVISSILLDDVAVDSKTETDPYVDFSFYLNFGVSGTGAYCRGPKECLANGTLISQYYAVSDNICSDEVGMETIISSEFVTAAYGSVCPQLGEEGLYYWPKACTMETATVGEGATYSPTPSPISPEYPDDESYNDENTADGKGAPIRVAWSTCALGFLAATSAAVWWL